MTNTRPDHLPDFGKPPLNEVALGVQFSPPIGYLQIRSGEVWSLFKSDYPVVQEQPPLEPAFETFGLQYGQFGGRIGFFSGAMHNRFWFLRNDGDELVQFQQDRLLHNWRKVGDQTNEYPRFEQMIERFGAEVRRLQTYFSTLSPQALVINQCEVSYINHIEVGTGPLNLSTWLRGMVIEGVEFDDVNIGLREVIRGENGQPIGRITYEVAAGFKPDGKRIIVLNLTARGAPKGTDIDSALQFIALGRELIVLRFAQVTTEGAHKAWERKQ